MNVSLVNQMDFLPLLEFKVSEWHVDIHNDYECVGVLAEPTGSIVFVFKRSEDGIPADVVLDFVDCEIVSGPDLNQIAFPVVVDNLSKSTLREGRYLFILSFLEVDREFEVECADVVLRSFMV